MPDIRQGLRQFPSGKRELNLLSGYVSTERAAPSDFYAPDNVATAMWVIIPGHSSDAVYGPLYWPAVNGDTLPIQGSAVLLAIDNFGTPWVVTWVGPHS